jgi:molybdopterin synthase catalytic subunit
MIRVQSEPFDLGEELARLRDGNHAIGGTAIFLGSVRDMHEGDRRPLR